MVNHQVSECPFFAIESEDHRTQPGVPVRFEESLERRKGLCGHLTFPAECLCRAPGSYDHNSEGSADWTQLSKLPVPFPDMMETVGFFKGGACGNWVGTDSSRMMAPAAQAEGLAGSEPGRCRTG
jgi:hypothetical protein